MENTIDLVRIVRHRDLDELVGQVLASTDDCLAISELTDDLDLDGICIIPTKDVLYLDRDFERRSFYQAALTAWAGKPQPAQGDVSLHCNVRQDLQEAARLGELVAVEAEVDDPDVIYIGLVAGLDGDVLRMSLISSKGLRVPELFEIDVPSITKVQIGTRYMKSVLHAYRALGEQVESDDD
jgi:hypothetical protein